MLISGESLNPDRRQVPFSVLSVIPAQAGIQTIGCISRSVCPSLLDTPACAGMTVFYGLCRSTAFGLSPEKNTLFFPFHIPGEKEKGERRRKR